MQDEEECIDRALNSIHCYVDEIIVVDGGSTDKTREIATSYKNVKLFDLPFRPVEGDRFDTHRNTAIALTEGEWVLVIDADEYYDTHVMKAIREELLFPERFGMPPATDAYAFSRRTFIDGRLMNVVNLDWQIRLFKRYCRYYGRMHEGVGGYSCRVDCNLHIMHDKKTEWQQLDNERCWDMGQQPAPGWVKLEGVWTWKPETAE